MAKMVTLLDFIYIKFCHILEEFMLLIKGKNRHSTVLCFLELIIRCGICNFHMSHMNNIQTVMLY